jgi:2-oxoglutarate dehydrogenase dihydrolipoamide succinyltransferase (E2 component)
MAKVEIMMPQMGESVMEGEVIGWSKGVGDTVEVDETLLEIATDKVDTEVPSPEAGVIVELLAQEGDTIEVGKPIAIIETDASAAATAAPTPSEAAPEQAAPVAPAPVEPAPEASAPAQSAPKAEPSPVATPQASGESIEVVMPQMGESVMEGEVLSWSKAIGDLVEVDETLLEIATDKVDTEVPSPEAGVLTEILAKEGETIQVGQVIARLAPAGSGASAAPSKASTPAPESKPAPAPQEAPAVKPQEPAASLNAETPAKGGPIPNTTPAGKFLSPLVRSIAEKEGIPVETLDQIPGTGKDGRLTKKDMLNFLSIRPPQTEGAPQPSQPATTGGGLSRPGAPASAPAQAAVLTSPATASAATSSSTGSINAGQLNVKAPEQQIEIIKMDRMRKMIAEHMVNSKQTSAHVTTFSDVDVTQIVKWRAANKDRFLQQTGAKLTFTPIFVESIIQAIREFPLINSSIVGDEIHVKKNINFGLAVALGEGGIGGLIVPVIKHAQDKNLAALAHAIADLATKARAKTLSPDDLVGGTITLTNYGSVGNLMGTPIINQPQVAIIGTGAIEKRPVVMETADGDVIAIRHQMYLSMSYDHRSIDGAHGGAFLNRIKQLLEGFDPNRSF